MSTWLIKRLADPATVGLSSKPEGRRTCRRCREEVLMSTTPEIGGSRSRPPSGRIKVRALGGALAFVGCYLLFDVVHGALTTRARAMPNAADEEIYQYLTQASAAVVANAVVGLCSAGGLLVFVLAARRLLTIRAVMPVRRGGWFGLLAFTALVVSSLLSLLLAASASGMSSSTAAGLYYAAFLSGGVVHAVCLGLFVGLTARAFAGRALRILSLIAAVPALLSIVSIVWFYGAALILLGRLLCMVWIVTAAIALVRTPQVRH